MSRLLEIMSPTRWAVAGAVLLALMLVLFGLHRHGVSTGRAEVQARWDAATAQAAQVQAGQNEAATKEVIVTETVTETKYRDRIKEVIRYVPKPDTRCPADPEFVRLFNGAD